MAKDIEKREIPFSPPDISELEIQYVADAMRSSWITTGPRTKELERKLAAWIQGYDENTWDNGKNPPRCVCLNSATAALELALRLLGIGEVEGGNGDDEVITCAYTYTASASTTAHIGAKIVFVDCNKDGDTLEMDYDALEKAITPNTKAIVPVDLAGIPCDYDKLFEIVEKKKDIFKPSNKIQEAIGRVVIVTDGAHALGAQYKGELVGNIADFTDFSFHAVKNFTTAEGGALMWKHIDGFDDAEIYHKIQLYGLHGQSKDALAKNKPGAWEYDIVGPWYKYNMTDIMASIGLAQLERYEGMLARRKEIIKKYDNAFKGIGIKVLEHYTDTYTSSGHLYITRIPNTTRVETNAIMAELANRGISGNVHYKPLPMMTAYKNMGWDIKDFPNAEARFEDEITLPLHTKLTDEDVEYIIENYVDIVGLFLEDKLIPIAKTKEEEFTGFDKKVWLSSPTMHGDELKYMSEAFYTNWMSTVGENINVIEKDIAKKIGVKYSVGLGTGTATLHMCMRLAGIKPGEKVFCTDMTFDATVNPIVYEGGVPIFIDSEYETWNMDPKALELAFEKHPDVRVVVVANLYGTPAKLDEIKAVCDKHDAILIEDAAESFGATYKGKQTGSFGKYNAISFNGNKIITGSAGGMFLTDSEKAAKKVRKWSTQARDNAPWYQHTELGYNYRISNVVAGVVRGQLPHLEEHIAQKKAIYERYKAGFKDLPVSMNPFDAKTSEPNYWLSCLLIDKDAMCKQERTDCSATYTTEEGKTCPTEILVALNKINAEGRPIWKPMHMQPIYSENEFISLSNKSVGADIFERGLCLPSDNKMTPWQQDKIIETIKKCFE